jgi:hypothetical protein
VSGVLNAAAGLATKVSKLPLPILEIGVGASMLGTGLRFAGSVAGMLGLDKPTSTAANQPIYRPTVNSMNNGSGLNVQNELAMDPNYAISNRPEKYSRTTEEVSYKHIQQKPGYFASFSFDGTATAGEVVHKMSVTPMTAFTYSEAEEFPTVDEKKIRQKWRECGHDKDHEKGMKAMIKELEMSLPGDEPRYTCLLTPCATVAYQHRYWCGTMKYHVRIVASKFTVGRIRISWHPSLSEIPTDMSEGEGDFISVVVDFCGDTHFNFSVPWCSDLLRRECEDTWTKTDAGRNGAVAFSIVQPVIVNTSVGDTSVYVNLFCAADKDMVFEEPNDRRCVDIGLNPTNYRFVGKYAWATTGIIAQGESSSCFLDDIFKLDFPSIIPATSQVVLGLLCGDRNDNFLDLMHRFYQVTEVTLVPGTTTFMDTLDASYTDGVYDMMNVYYLYRSGGFNNKLISSPDTTSTAEDQDGSVWLMLAPISDGGTRDDPWVNYSKLYGRNGTLVEDIKYKPAIEWHTPWHHNLAFIPTTLGGFSSEHTAVTTGARFYRRGNGTSASRKFYWFRSIDDSSSFGWACGAPTITRPGWSA